MKDYTEKTPDEMTQKDIDEMWADLAETTNEYNKKATASNNRLIKVVERMHGKAFVKHFLELLKDCEAVSQMGFLHTYQIVRNHGGTEVETNEYGRKLRKYWVDQWAVGLEGDSWSGYVYVEIKPNRYIKVPFDM